MALMLVMRNSSLTIDKRNSSRILPRCKNPFCNKEWSDLINTCRKSRFIQIMDDLFWQPISYEENENEGRRTEFLIDSDMTHWIQCGRSTKTRQRQEKYDKTQKPKTRKTKKTFLIVIVILNWQWYDTLEPAWEGNGYSRLRMSNPRQR